MISFFSRLFGKKKDYAAQRGDMQSSDVKDRMALAKGKNTKAEILYYLAVNDPEEKVRAAVVKNNSLPMKVAPVVAKDKSENVRFVLAERLCKILPDAGQDKHSQLYAHVAQAMATLALDEVLKIRKALSSALKDSVYAPPDVVKQLAMDVQREVAEPILRHCTALSDEDILEIIQEHPDPWAVRTIADRFEVTESVSHAVITKNDRPAGEVLLNNENALISAQTFSIIVERAKEFEEWQRPLAVRKKLPKSLVDVLAGFASEAVRAILEARNDFAEDELEKVVDTFERRMDFANDKTDDAQRDETPLEKAQRLNKDGRLDDEAITDAIGMRDTEFIYCALAVLANTNYKMAEKICDMKAPKPIIALVWKAGLSMRTALSIQKDFVQVPPKELIYPRGGTDFPLSKKDLNWQLDFLGCAKNKIKIIRGFRGKNQLRHYLINAVIRCINQTIGITR
jgi:uncharacterized protein (DUF2336 family)